MQGGAHRAGRVGVALLLSTLMVTTLVVIAPTTPAARAQEAPATPSLGDGLDPGKIRYVAGVAARTGFAGDGGPATEAFLHCPTGVSVASNGDVYIADTTNQRICKVDGTTGIIATIAGTGTAPPVG